MLQATEILHNVDLAKEVANVPLKDQRLSRRVAEIVVSFARSPEASVPRAIGSEAEAEAYHRLMRNERVEHAELLESHMENTYQRARAVGAILVIHDTTEFAFNIHDEPRREHLSRLSTQRSGFYWHASLVLTDDSLRAPLGLVASRPYVHRGQVESATDVPERLAVNVVEVLEVHPPEGEEAVRWLLMTDQPVETDEEVWQVVDRYRARWMIEESFKALKTGTGHMK